VKPAEIQAVQRAGRGITFDTGMLIALERRKASALALFRACRLSRARITIPAAVVTEWWRGSHGALLESGTLEPLSIDLARQAGLLLAKTRKANAVDAIVIASAARRGDLVATSDPSDLVELARHVERVKIVRV
jgi:predicted nucleic acid-binding protein